MRESPSMGDYIFFNLVLKRKLPGKEEI